MISYTELIVTDAEGCCAGTLGDIVENAPANLDTATVRNGKITEWPQFFLSAEGEEAGWDTPRVAVDWTGFVGRLASASA
jgi:hypothetical protein